MGEQPYKEVPRHGAFSDLSYLVECKSTYPFFETIAAFNVRRAAEAYVLECAKVNPTFTYRIAYVR
jgi:hypothetical protein